MRLPHIRRWLPVVALLLLTACGPEEDPAAPPSPPPEATGAPATPTEATPTPTPTPTPSPTPTETPTMAPEEQWANCSNSEDGYAIDYPAAWATNEEPVDEVPPCSLFDPDPGQLRSEGNELPTDIAVAVRVQPVPFDEVTAESTGSVERDRAEAAVDGRSAVRRELESTGEGLYAQGLQFTVWAVDLDGRTFVAQTFDSGEPDYTTTQQVLDDMVASVRFDQGGRPACSAAGLAADPAPADGVPEAVEETRASITEAAISCDFDRLAGLAGEEFSFSFGAGGDPAGYWRDRESEGAEPLALLVELLDRPHATVETSAGTQYVWPSAFGYETWEDVPEADREALRPLYDDADFADFEAFGSYAGHRVGILEDGSWLYFVAGD